MSGVSRVIKHHKGLQTSVYQWLQKFIFEMVLNSVLGMLKQKETDSSPSRFDVTIKALQAYLCPPSADDELGV